jgi:hypothetical protein
MSQQRKAVQAVLGLLCFVLLVITAFYTFWDRNKLLALEVLEARNFSLTDLFDTEEWLGNDTTCTPRILIRTDGRIGGRDCVPLDDGGAFSVGRACPNSSYVVSNIWTDDLGRVLNVTCVQLSNGTLLGVPINSDTSTITGTYGVTVDLAARGPGAGTYSFARSLPVITLDGYAGVASITAGPGNSGCLCDSVSLSLP